MTKLKEKINIEELFFQSATKVEAYVVTITPQIARELLEQTDSRIQRTINTENLNLLCSEMELGNFEINGMAICQDVNGNTINGQHRLTACIKTNLAFNTVFVKGLSPMSIHTIDIGGKARSLADVLEISHQKKYKYANSIAAAVKFIYSFNNGCYILGIKKSNNTYLTSTKFLEWMDKNSTITDFIEDTMRLRANGDKMITPAMFCGLKWILDRYSKDRSSIFFQQLSDGIGVDRDSPLFTLRKKILSTKFSGTGNQRIKLSSKELVFIIIRTWNAFIKGDTLTYMKVPKEMPKILHK
jgi:hypothetical protein